MGAEVKAGNQEEALEDRDEDHTRAPRLAVPTPGDPGTLTSTLSAGSLNWLQECGWGAAPAGPAAVLSQDQAPSLAWDFGKARFPSHLVSGNGGTRPWHRQSQLQLERAALNWRPGSQCQGEGEQ